MNKDDDKRAEYFAVMPEKLVRGTWYTLLVPVTAYLAGSATLCMGETETGEFACKRPARHLEHVEQGTGNASLSSSYAFQITLANPGSGFLR